MTYALFCALDLMNNKRTYNFLHRGSAVLMIIALCWLTVSTPFVYQQQKELAKHSKLADQSPLSATEEENGNQLGNNTEEKTPKSLTTFSEEYLHDHHRSDHLFSAALQYNKNEDAGIYTAYHGEPLVPPPNVA